MAPPDQQGSAGGSQHGSDPPSPARSRAGSNAGSAQPGGSTGPFHKGTGVDPAFDPNDPRTSRVQMTDTELIGKRVDLPAEAFSSVSTQGPTRVISTFSSIANFGCLD